MQDQDELQAYRASLAELETDATPVIVGIAKHTKSARRAMDADPVDTLTLSNELVELSILNQRMSDRLANAGYLVRGCKEFYERVREGHKVRLVQVGEPKETKSTSSSGVAVTSEEFVTVAAGVADSMKVGLSHAEFEVYNDCERFMDRLVYARKSTDKTIDSIRSKLSYEKQNERNA